MDPKCTTLKYNVCNRDLGIRYVGIVYPMVAHFPFNLKAFENKSYFKIIDENLKSVLRLFNTYI